MQLIREREVLAFDNASARAFNEDGHLHVLKTNISKAAVNPYMGVDIPRYRELGLDPARLYRLFRHPDELARAAPTFNGIPVLSQHVHVTSERHRPDLVIGATGSEAAFDATGGYLQNRLSIWPDRSIQLIESGVSKQLSSSYRYDPDMTPGEHEGVAFDGVMRNLRGNHVAVVPRGRAGPDVAVADSAPPRRRFYYGTESVGRRFKGSIA